MNTTTTTLSYTTVPTYTSGQIRYSAQVNRTISLTCSNNAIKDCIGSALVLDIGTYMITYTMTLSTANNIIQFTNVWVGLSNLSSNFTNQGFTNKTFQKNTTLCQLSTNASQSFTGVQTFCVQASSTIINLLGCCIFSTGGTSSFYGVSTIANGLQSPLCNIIATRIS